MGGSSRAIAFRKKRWTEYVTLIPETLRINHPESPLVLRALRRQATKFILEQMRVEKSSHTVFTPLDDGTGVLLNVDTLLYYSLNRTAVAIWKKIEGNSPLTTNDLVPVICQRFEVDGDAARREIAAFLEKLEELKILRVV